MYSFIEVGASKTRQNLPTENDNFLLKLLNTVGVTMKNIFKKRKHFSVGVLVLSYVGVLIYLARYIA